MTPSDTKSASLKELRFLLTHSSIYGLGNVLSKSVGFLLIPLYTRFLTPTDYGLYELTAVTIGMLSIVLGIGVTSAMTRFYYEREEPEARNTVVSTTLVLVGCAAGAGILVVLPCTGWLAEHLLDSREHTLLLVIAVISLGASLLLDVVLLYLRLLHRSIMFITLALIKLLIAISLNILFIAVLEYGAIGFFYASTLTNTALLIPLSVWLVRRVGLRFSRGLARRMIEFSAPLVPSRLATAVVTNSDRYFVKFLDSLDATGVYAIANKVGSSIHLGITSPFLMTYLPRRFEIAEHKDSHAMFRMVFNVYMMIMVTAALVLAVFSDLIVRQMTVEAYYGAARLVPWIALTAVMFGTKYHFEFGILYTKKTKYYLYINLLIGVLHLVLNYILVSRYKVDGAVATALVTSTLGSALLYVVSQRLHRVQYDLWRNAKLLGIAGAVFALSRWQTPESVWLALGWGLALVLLFAVLVVVTGLFPRDQFGQIGELLRGEPKKPEPDDTDEMTVV